MLTTELMGKQVLVTGAGGFIGSHLVEELARRGARVRALVRYKSRGVRGWLEEMDEAAAANVEIFPGDITDLHRVREALEDRQIVWHLAALIGIPYSYHAPTSYVDVNVRGTLNVLEAARAEGVEQIVHVSTSEVYGTPGSVPISEDAPLQGQSPYAATKIAADKLAESYWLSFDLPVVIARPFNAFGPRQSSRAVVPTIAAQVLGGAPVLRIGALEPTRDLNYVANTVDGLIAAGFAPDEALGKVINLGSGEEIAVGELARRIMQIAGREIPIESDPARRRPPKSEVARLLCDNRRAKQWLGWTPRVGLDEGLRSTVEWIGRHLQEYRVEEYTI